MAEKDSQILYQVDEQDQPIGQVTRQKANSSPDIIHRAVGVFLYNLDGKVLLQKRSSQKDTFPNCWDISLSGHVDYGDDYLTAAEKRLSDELGLLVPPERLTELGKVLVRLPWENEWRTIYRYTIPEGTEITYPPEEVSEVKFATLAEVKRMLEDADIKWSDKARQMFGHFIFE